jgi:hypothetical protein
VASAPAPQFEPIQVAQTAVIPEPVIAAEAEEKVEHLDAESPAEAVAPIQQVEYVEVIHLTRTWVQYGILGFAVLCIVIGAVEALFGR